jgi:hypothetical protein
MIIGTLLDSIKAILDLGLAVESNHGHRASCLERTGQARSRDLNPKGKNRASSPT